MKTSWMRRHWFLSALLAFLGLIVVAIGTVALLIRDRWVSWQEEVPLNTGETIIVKRTMPWELVWGWGANPVFRGAHSRQTLEFVYKGKSYSYSGGADVGWVAISPEGTPNLVALPSNLSWDRRNFYYCVVPFYVQFKPSADGKTWTWPKQVEPWLYGLPYNLMGTTDESYDKPKGLIRQEERKRRDDSWTRSPTLVHAIRIDAFYQDSSCPRDIATMNIPTPTWTQK